MGDGPPGFRQGFSCPVVLRCHSRSDSVSSTGLSPSLAGLPRPLDYRSTIRRQLCRADRMVLQPDTCNAGRLAQMSFRLVPVRSPLLGESQLISFPEGTEMFQFPSFAAPRLCIQRGLDRLSSVAVSRFGDRRVNACIRLAVAYRSFTTSFIASWCQGIHRMPLLA